MKRAFFFAIFCFYTCCANAQAGRTPVSFYPSINAFSSQFKDAFSFRSNSASLAGLKQFSAGIFSERRFLLEELSSYSMAVGMPTSSGNFGLKADYFGGQLFRESSIGLVYGRSLGKQAAIGVGFNYVSLNAAGYGSAATVTFDAGAIFQITEQLQTGIHIYNPVGMKLGKTGEEKLPSLYSVGLGYDISPQLYIGTEAIKTEDQPLSINAGIHYAFADKLIARGGISSGTSVFYLGFGVLMKSFRVDVSASFHPYLGTTPGLLFLYSPTK